MNPNRGANGETALARPPASVTTARVRDAMEAAVRYLLNRQTSKGHWVGQVEGDTTLLSDYILLQLWLHEPGADGRWNPPTRQRVDAACRSILREQLDDGGWSIFRGGPANVSASVKAYTALMIAGHDPACGPMVRAAARIRELGGIEAANSYTKLYLSYFGLVPRDQVPSIPPEIFLLPRQHRFSIYSISAWSRAIIAPLSILDATRARRPVPAGSHLGTLASGQQAPLPEFPSWKRLFLLLDRGIKLMEVAGKAYDRSKAVAAASDWMHARLRRSAGLGAIFPAMVNSIMALTQLGYDRNHPVVRREIGHFEDLIIEDENGFRVQPCHSPVWDTALTAFAIGQARNAGDKVVDWALGRAADWLLDKQARHSGDWSVHRPGLEPGGWYFEYRNEHYPDTDDTAKVLLALGSAKGTDAELQRASERRALEWLASMQSANGGWAAFDPGNDSSILTEVPFADHNAMLDPPCPDITGRVLEALCQRAPGQYRDVVERGVRYLRGEQDMDGCWHGRWGVNHLYGTCFALRGLRAAGVPERDSAVLLAGEWVRSVQNIDGGWGESAATYDSGSRQAGAESTPSQTAWALMALFATGDYGSGAVEEGLRYLLERQLPQGTWEERACTGTGFPRVFYLRYHMYPQYFPLMALAAYDRRDSWQGTP